MLVRRPRWLGVSNSPRTLEAVFRRLVLSVVLPVLILAILLAALLVDYERQTARRAAAEYTSALVAAVDASMAGAVDVLKALSRSASLARNDVRAFHGEASRVLQTQQHWLSINLAEENGQQVVNVLEPPGAPLPSITEMGSHERALREKSPVVGEVIWGRVSQQYTIAVRLPVLLGTGRPAVLSAILKPDRLNQLLLQAGLPADWTAAVLDRGGRLAGRSVAPERFVGQPAGETLRSALAQAPQGWFRGQTLEGTSVFTAYETSAVTGLAVAVGIPASAFNAGAIRVASLVALGFIAAVVLALWLARTYSRRIVAPISSLAPAAHSIAHGGAMPALERFGVAELDDLAASLSEAGQAVRERERQRDEAEAALRAANRAKDEFLATLSHEMRNPLAAIRNAVHLAGLSRDDPGHRQALDILERQSRQLAALIEDLLDISGLTLGKIALRTEPLDLGALVTTVVDAWRASGRLRRHKVQVSADAVWVHGDIARLEQVVSNLLGNAVKYTPSGRRIDLTVKREGASALLLVADEGEGMTRELQDRVFDLFVQGPQSIERSHGGLGIGLAVVRRLVEAHGGSAAVRSEGSGQGATLIMRLPAIAAPALDGQAQPSRPTQFRHIVLIEDNADARRALSLVLKAHGHRVDEAADGLQGFALVRASRPDVALVDIGLPGIDGYEVARRIRGDPACSEVRLVALTGYGQAEDRRMAAQVGFDAHLTKPADFEALTRAIGGTAR
jgi:signal transduction histidine kinase